jgi:hypothetical protein
MLSGPPTRLNKNEVYIRRTVKSDLRKNNSSENKFYISIQKGENLAL